MNHKNKLPSWVTFIPILVSFITAIGMLYQLQFWYMARDFSSIQFPFLFASVIGNLLNLLVAFEIKKVTNNYGNVVSLSIGLLCSLILIFFKLKFKN